MNSTASFDQVQATYLHPARNSSSNRGEHELVVFLEKYYSFFLLIFGTVGNLLCLAVLSRETFRRSSAGIYLRFLTLSDLAAIYTGVLFFTARALFHNNFRKTDELSCKFHRWLSFMACDLSSWALVLVSTARLLSIAWPMKRLITRRRVYASIVVTIIVLFAANLPIFIIYGDVRDPVRNKTSLCVFTQDSYQDFYIYVFSWLVLIKFAFLPGVLLIVLNAALVLSVSRSGRAVEQPLSRKSHPVASSGPADRDPKTKMSKRKRKLEKEYSSNNTPDLESSEVSTGSEFSDRTLSTSDASEVSAADKADSRLSGAWNKILGRLQLTSWCRSQDYRIQESSLRRLFRGVQMLWQRDELESQKDLVSLDGDASNCHPGQDSTVDEKRSQVACTETDLSWLDQGGRSGTETSRDPTRIKTPGKDYVLTENTTNMADGSGVQRTWHELNYCSASRVNPPARSASAGGGNTSMGVAVEVPRQDLQTVAVEVPRQDLQTVAQEVPRQDLQTVAVEVPRQDLQTVSDRRDPSSSCLPCNDHINSHVENIHLQHDMNTTAQQPTTHPHTTLSSNNVRTLSGNQECVSNILHAQTCQGVSGNCQGNVAEGGLLPLSELHSSDINTRTGTGQQVNMEDSAAFSGDRNQLKQATRASLTDVSVPNVSTANTGNSSTNQDKDIAVNVNNETPCYGACVDVEHRSKHTCVHVNHTQGPTHLTGHDQGVCAYSISETSSSPRGTGSNSPSCSCGSCPGTAAACTQDKESPISCGSCSGTAAACTQDKESSISSGLGTRTNSESAPASAATSQNHRTHTGTHNAITQADQVTEQPAVSQTDTRNAETGYSVTQVGQVTEQPAVSQTDTRNAKTGYSVTQADQVREQPAVSQTDTRNAETGDRVTQVEQKTELSAVSDRHAHRRKSGLPRKVANKSRSLTRTLLVLNTVFLLCNTPITVYMTGKAYFWPDAVEYNDVQEITVTVANFSMYTSNSINFILYCVTGSRFRGQLVLMFKELYYFVCSCVRRLSRVNKQRI